MHAIMVSRCTLKIKSTLCIVLTFLFLSEGDVRSTQDCQQCYGGGGGRVRKAIFIEQLKFLFSEKTQICHCILIIQDMMRK